MTLSLVRKYFWFIHFVFIAVASFAFVRIVNAFFENSLLNASQPMTASLGNAAYRFEKLSAEGLAKVTGVPLSAETVPLEPEEEGSEIPRTTLPLRLLGTLVAQDVSHSAALIQDTATHQALEYATSDTVHNATVLEVQRSRVIILNKGRKEFIDGSAEAILPLRAEGPTRVAFKVTAEGVKQLSNNTYEISSELLNNALSNLNDIALQANIVPHFENGLSSGFRVFNIREGAMYSKLGIQNGDVIRRINGFDMNAPEKLLEVYMKLRSSPRLELELRRGGAVVRKIYNVH